VRSVNPLSTAIYAGVTVAWIAWIVLLPLLFRADDATVRPLVRLIGGAGLLLTLALAPIALRRDRRRDDEAWRATALLKLDAMKRAIDAAASESGLTEAAKRVLHRKEERQLLRDAIEQDIERRDWDAAMILVKELAERFGYRADAEEFRTRIERARAQTLDREVLASMETLEAHIANRQWSDAMHEADRITRMYPDSPRVDGLRNRVVASKGRYKIELVGRFLEASEREHIDTAMTLLRELDPYLAESEAEPLQEAARRVISKARDNLGVRFKLLVQDHAWTEAVKVGEEIMEQFPNTRMSQEVRDVIDSVREKAASTRKALTH